MDSLPLSHRGTPKELEFMVSGSGTQRGRSLQDSVCSVQCSEGTGQSHLSTFLWTGEQRVPGAEGLWNLPEGEEGLPTPPISGRPSSTSREVTILVQSPPSKWQ